jgi:tyrosyl-tRNA synthetase
MFRYYELLSDANIDEIVGLKRDMEAGTLHPKEIKMRLARELTTRFHSEDAAQNAEKNFENVFQQKGLPEDIPEMALQSEESIWLPQLLVDTGMVKSSSEGRRMIQQNAVSLDSAKIDDMNYSVEPSGEVLLRVGKRRFCKVIFQ